MNRIDRGVRPVRLAGWFAVAASGLGLLLWCVLPGWAEAVGFDILRTDAVRGTTGQNPVETAAQGFEPGADAPDARVAALPVRSLLGAPRPAPQDTGWTLVDSRSFLAYLPVATACAIRFDAIGDSLAVAVPTLPLTDLALQAIGYAPDWLGFDLADSFRRMDAVHQDLYAGVILGAADPIVDEIAFVIAHTAPQILGSAGFYTGLLTENAQEVYANDAFLDYVDIVDYGSALAGGDYYSTARYWTAEAGETLEVMLPRERYYWDIVHLKITDEFPTYINPANGAVAAPPVGRFWREFLFAYADSTYPALKDQLAGCRVLWEGNVDSITNGAVGILTQWILDVMNFGSGAERPIQPVRIYRLHLGRCGEHADITAAAARAALIPTNSAAAFDNDHTWNEFWDRRWIAWEPVNVYVDAPLHYEGWGMQFIGVFDWRGDDGAWTVTERYTPTCTFTAAVTDSFGKPVDGALVKIARKTGTVSYVVSTWGVTGSDGRVTFKLGDNQDIYARIESPQGSVPPGALYKLAVSGTVAGQNYLWEKSLANPMPRLAMLPATPPVGAPLEYQLRVNWEVAGEYSYYQNQFDNNTASDNFPDGTVEFFICDEVNYGAYAAADTFWAFEISEDAASGDVAFTVPTGDDYYVVLSNQEHVVDSEVVGGTAQLWWRPAAGVAGGAPIARLATLGQVRPNPARGETRIGYSLPADAEVDLAVYAVDGRLVTTLVKGQATAGEHRAAWDGRDRVGKRVAPGLYVLRLTAAGSSLSRKVVLLSD